MITEENLYRKYLVHRGTSSDHLFKFMMHHLHSTKEQYLVDILSGNTITTNIVQRWSVIVATLAYASIELKIKCNWISDGDISVTEWDFISLTDGRKIPKNLTIGKTNETANLTVTFTSSEIKISKKFT